MQEVSYIVSDDELTYGTEYTIDSVGEITHLNHYVLRIAQGSNGGITLVLSYQGRP